jgi:RHS repeat-associated protein
MTEANGLYYMRARYYNPEIKRFINQDVIVGSINDGRSLNRYAYAGGNPVTMVDPFGLSPEYSPSGLMNTLYSQLGSLFMGGDGRQSSGDSFFNRIVSRIEGIPLVGSGIIGAARLGNKAYNSAKSWLNNLSPTTKIIVGTAVIVGLGVATVLTGGATAVVLGAAFKGACIGAAIGATSGAAVGAITGYISDGWEGAKKGAWQGATTGYMTGAITGALTGAAKGIKEVAHSRQALGVVDDGVGVGNSRKYWTNTTEHNGVKVYQRNDLIDPNRIDNYGRTNLQRMQGGTAPIGPDGNSINLHHMTQRNSSAIAELTQSFHQTYRKIIHINPNSIPSGIDRALFDSWKKGYWISRAAGF